MGAMARKKRAKKAPTAEEEMLTIKEAAEWLGVTISAISQAITRGRLPVVPFKNWRLISPQALKAYAASRSKGGRPRKSTTPSKNK